MFHGRFEGVVDVSYTPFAEERFCAVTDTVVASVAAKIRRDNLSNMARTISKAIQLSIFARHEYIYDSGREDERVIMNSLLNFLQFF